MYDPVRTLLFNIRHFITILLFLVIAYPQQSPSKQNIFNVQVDSLSQILDSLNLQKNKIEHRISELEDVIKSIKFEKILAETKSQKLISTTYKVVREAKLKDDPAPLATSLLLIPSKSTVLVYNEYINGYYKVKYRGTTGYLSDI